MTCEHITWQKVFEKTLDKLIGPGETIYLSRLEKETLHAALDGALSYGINYTIIADQCHKCGEDIDE